MNILHITSSANAAASTSTLLGTEIAEKLAGTLVTRDTNASLPALDSAWVAANFTPAATRTDAQVAALSLSDQIVAELKAADTLIISAPIYNFGIPSTLKAWIDMICRVGETFEYSAEGPKGLLEGKRAILALSSGGTKVGSDIDFASGYLRHILGFVGITQVEVIAADRISAEGDQAMANARSAISALQAAA